MRLLQRLRLNRRHRLALVERRHLLALLERAKTDFLAARGGGLDRPAAPAPVPAPSIALPVEGGGAATDGHESASARAGSAPRNEPV